MPQPLRLGEVTVQRVIDMESPAFAPIYLLPDATPEAIQPYLDWLTPRFVDPATGKLILVIQTYVVRTHHHTILIDTCVGEDKERSFSPDWHLRSGTRYLADLAAAGAPAEEVDFVMCTHLHPDHVGWNTRLVDGRWVPTFPNARYVFAAEEWEFWEPKFRRDPRKFGDGAGLDSVLPIVEAGRAEMVEGDHVLDDDVRLEPTPGHTPGHVAVRIGGREDGAVMTGDLIHSVLQCAEPDWCSAACFDKERSRATRRRILEESAENRTLMMTAHFPSPSIGRAVRRGDVFGFDFLEDDV